MSSSSRPYPSLVPSSLAPADELVELACLTFQPDDSVGRRRRARRLALANPGLVAESFCAAVVVGDVAVVRELLADDAGAATRPAGPRGWVPLLYLCFSRVMGSRSRCDAVAVAKLLLAAGADPNSHSLFHGRYRFSAITGAVGEGESGPIAAPPHPQARALVELLLEAGADPNDSQALYDTHFRRDDGWLELFLSRGLGPEDRANWTEDDSTGILDYLLGQAVRQGFLDRAALLLARGASPNGRNHYNRRAHLENALLDGHVDIAALLVRHGATPAALSPAEELRAACLRGDDRAVRARWPEGISGRDDTGTLLAAAAHGRLPAVRLLLELGVPINASNDEGLTPLHMAASNGHRLVVDELLARGASLDIRDRVHGGSPLSRTTWFCRAWPTMERDDVQQALVERSTDVFDVVHAGATDRLAILLAEDPSRARARRPDGRTPLHVVAANEIPSHEALIELLLRHGAELDARNDKGQTALDLAVESANDEVAGALARWSDVAPRPSAR